MNIEDKIKEGIDFHRKGRLEEARLIYEKILERNPDHLECKKLLNLVLVQEYKKGKALDLIAESSQEKYKSSSYCNNLGVSFYNKGELGKAIFWYKKALEIDSGLSNVYNNLGVVFNDQGNFDAAVICYRKALEGNPKNVNALNNIASIYKARGNLHEARLYYIKALEIEPDHIKALYNLGSIFKENGELCEAEYCFRKLLRVTPDYAEGKQNLGIILLLKGELEEGFKLYEARWEANKLKARFSGIPWEGQNLRSKTILLQSEQGIGDTIQFVRYAPLVKDLGCKVILAVQPSLIGFLSNVEGVDEIISYDTDEPPYDYQISLLSLPYMFKTNLNTIPNDVPYIRVEDRSVKKWKNIINDSKMFKVGLVWAGNPKNTNDKRRSFSIDTLNPLLSLKGVEFFSLQLGERVKELETFGLNRQIRDLSGYFKDTRDTAAAITLMDVVISVDTSVAHISGALAHPTWVMLAFAPDWRWMLNREDSPWYPSMRLFRQSSAGDWGTVVEEIKRKLTQILQNKQ